MFSMFLGDDAGITFGGWNPEFMNNPAEEFKWAPLAETNYWTLEIVDIYRIDVDSNKNEKVA